MLWFTFRVGRSAGRPHCRLHKPAPPASPPAAAAMAPPTCPPATAGPPPTTMNPWAGSDRSNIMSTQVVQWAAPEPRQSLSHREESPLVEQHGALLPGRQGGAGRQCRGGGCASLPARVPGLSLLSAASGYADARAGSTVEPCSGWEGKGGGRGWQPLAHGFRGGGLTPALARSLPAHLPRAHVLACPIPRRRLCAQVIERQGPQQPEATRSNQ